MLAVIVNIELVTLTELKRNPEENVKPQQDQSLVFHDKFISQNIDLTSIKCD